MKKILAQVRKADSMFHMIDDGDRIAVGISGGKDSSLLLYTLYLYQFLYRNTYQKEFEIVGVHIDLNFGEDDFTPLLEWFSDKERKDRLQSLFDIEKRSCHPFCQRTGLQQSGLCPPRGRCDRDAVHEHDLRRKDRNFRSQDVSDRFGNDIYTSLLSQFRIRYRQDLQVTVYPEDLIRMSERWIHEETGDQGTPAFDLSYLSPGKGELPVKPL